MTFVPGTYAPAFVASIVACALALVVVRGRIPDLPRPTAAERPYVYGTALWATGIVLLRRRAPVARLPASTTRCGSGSCRAASSWARPSSLWERRRRAEHAEAVRIERRPVTVALFVGLVIAIAQIVPMSQLPLYFGVGMGYGPLFGIVALAPLFVALVAAGPVAGFLLARFPPRNLVAGGVMVIGVGDLLLAALDRAYHDTMSRSSSRCS